MINDPLPPTGPILQSPPRAEAARFTYASGDRPLEGYTIKRGIGRGGFGEVYYGLSDGGKEVALKLVQRNLEVELRGVSQCLNLKHHNLVALYDVKQSETGDYWVVMEYVSGESLADCIDRHPQGMPAQQALQWMQGICAGVAYLHDRGIVHRDLKPANLFMEEGVVKIGDYGLAKFITASRRSGQTESVGTVHYMAPEIANGCYGKEIDIYAAGTILYEMLTGQVPFDGESVGEILMKHLTAQPDTSALAEPYRAVVARALAKDAADRYPSAGALLEQLQGSSAPGPEYASVTVVEPPPPSTRQGPAAPHLARPTVQSPPMPGHSPAKALGWGVGLIVFGLTRAMHLNGTMGLFLSIGCGVLVSALAGSLPLFGWPGGTPRRQLAARQCGWAAGLIVFGFAAVTWGGTWRAIAIAVGVGLITRTLVGRLGRTSARHPAEAGLEDAIGADRRRSGMAVPLLCVTGLLLFLACAGLLAVGAVGSYAVRLADPSISKDRAQTEQVLSEITDIRLPENFPVVGSFREKMLGTKMVLFGNVKDNEPHRVLAVMAFPRVMEGKIEEMQKEIRKSLRKQRRTRRSSFELDQEQMRVIRGERQCVTIHRGREDGRKVVQVLAPFRSKGGQPAMLLMMKPEEEWNEDEFNTLLDSMR